MYEVTKADWKLFQAKIGPWQEAYMERLNQEYARYLSDTSIPASKRFWTMEKRIRKDQHNPGVLIDLRKSNVPRDLERLIRLRVIKEADLSDFSEELKQDVRERLSMR